MIDFACKKFNIDEVISCGLGLTKAEFKIFKFLLSSNRFFNTSQISESLKLELSTVQRAVKKLYSNNILVRNQKNISGGGYVYEYKIKDRKEIKIKVLQIISSWTSRVESEFDNW